MNAAVIKMLKIWASRTRIFSSTTLKADDADGVIATFVIFALVILGMSLGYTVKRKSIQAAAVGSPALGLEESLRLSGTVRRA